MASEAGNSSTMASNDGNCLTSRSNDVNDTDSRDERDLLVPEVRRPVYDPCSMDYDMTGERLLFVFNHTHYHMDYATPRSGTEYDIARLHQTFSNLNFKMDEPFMDLPHGSILDQLKSIFQMDHSRTSCVAIVVSSHGDEGGKVFAYDRPYPISDVINLILKAESLAKVPKLFFIQACRGRNVDSGLQFQTDGGVRITIPTFSHCLVLMSSYEGQVSYRGKGSWMIQDLCDILDEHHHNLDILQMMTLVHNKVAARVSHSLDPKHHYKKQIPETRFTLSKFLKF